MPARLQIAPGTTFGRWTYLADAPKKGRIRMAMARCSCGVERDVALSNLVSGLSQSCGCLKLEALSARGSQGRADHPETYMTWKAMRQRCNDPNASNYRWYGARGVGVCKRWDSFDAFLADVGPRPDGLTLDRIDPDGNYEPGNCRWATPAEQGANRRKAA